MVLARLSNFIKSSQCGSANVWCYTKLQFW